MTTRAASARGGYTGRALALVGIAVVALLLGVGIAAAAPTSRAILLGLTASLLATPVVRRAVAGRFDPLEPIFLILLAYGVMFVARPLAMLASGDLVYRISGRGIGIDDTFDRMLLLGTIGAAALVAGYECPVGARLARRLRAPINQFSERVLLQTTLVFAVIGFALVGAFIVRSGGLREGLALLFSGRSAQLAEAVRDSSKYLYFGPYLLIPATLVSLALGLRHQRYDLLALSAGLALSVLVIRGPVGSRMTLLPLFGGAVIYLCFLRHRRPGIFVVTGGLLVALALSTFLVGVRDAAQRQQTGIGGPIAAMREDPTVIFDPLLQGQDAAESAALAAALTVIPDELPHTNGRAFLADVITRPIPRSLWPGKPISPREQTVALLWPQLEGVANPEFTPLLGFYLDGGLAGVVIGLLIYGVLLRTGYCYLCLHERTLIVRLVYALSLPLVAVLLRDTPVDTLARAAFLVGPLVIGYQLARQR